MNAATIFRMALSFRQITAHTANRLKLVMADVDGTLTDSGNDIIESVREAVTRLERRGILVGLVSGRTVRMLEELALILDCHGPIIAENGGIARESPQGPYIELGYSRKPALDALSLLKRDFPGRIKERYDNNERFVDIVFHPQGVGTEEIKTMLSGVQLLDSGYICHLMQEGISKGRTLLRLMDETGGGELSEEDVLVVGDSLTDISLFELFPHSVLIPNYRMDKSSREILECKARYISVSQAGEGFSEVAFHILDTLTR